MNGNGVVVAVGADLNSDENNLGGDNSLTENGAPAPPRQSSIAVDRRLSDGLCHILGYSPSCRSCFRLA
jgi:hypothetical protein